MCVKDKIFKIIIYIFLVFFIGIFIYSLVNIISWKIDSNKTDTEIKKIQKMVKTENKKDNKETVIIINDEKEDNNYYTKYQNYGLIDVDIKELKKTNSDVVGWIKVNGIKINYPFVQTKDNDFYLRHSFDKSYNKAGWVFLDYRNNKNEFGKNNILYAHGRMDNTMFGSLRDALKASWLNNDNNHVIYISTEDSNSLWQVFSIYKIPTTNDYIQVDFANNNEYLKFLDKIKSRSIHDFNVNLYEDDKIITLSTCHNSKYKIVLHAKLVKYEKKES